MTRWEIRSRDPAAEQSSTEFSDTPIKWAHDSTTSEPRYIHDTEVVEKKCVCACPACHLTLTPVLPGQPEHIRPTSHFRHPPGSQKDDCTIVSARLAATQYFLDSGFIDLPRRAMSRTAKGFSGENYEVWVEIPAERRAISRAHLIDHATAELVLDDGRILLVDLTGSASQMDYGSGPAVVSISISDSSLAMLSPEEIRSRLRILPDVRWCAHWQDQTLAAKGDGDAAQMVRDALDGWSAKDEADFAEHLPPDLDEGTVQCLRRETLLHREVKSILSHAHQIRTPGLEITVKRDPPEEFIGEWDAPALRMTWMTGDRTLGLAEVTLERRLGRIVPDVIASLGDPSVKVKGFGFTAVSTDDGDYEESDDPQEFTWVSPLLVEVTVTHGIDDVKLRRIQRLNLPTLEIDLRPLGGRLTREALEDLVINQTIGKCWVHHPVYSIQKYFLNAAIDKHPTTIRYKERLFDLRVPYWRSQTVSYWAEQYLNAVSDFYRKKILIHKARRQAREDAPVPESLSVYSDEWLRVLDCASAMSIHGLQGANDPLFLDDSGLVARVLSIQHNTGIGYDVSSGYQVVNAIMQSARHNKQWDSIYEIAVNAFHLEKYFTDPQQKRYNAWRQSLSDGILNNDIAYLRPSKFDVLLSTLFPAMADAIGTGYGRLVE